jgi:hypothetical protein
MTLTPTAVRWIALGSILSLSSAVLAQTPASDADFAGSLAAIAAQTKNAAAHQKNDAVVAAAAQKAQAASVPALLARVQPDYSFTPGHLCNPSDPNFKEYRYAEHIPYCQRNVTQQMKQTVAAHYSVPQTDWVNYEFDHLIPLAIGGDSSIDNLWPQPHEEGSEDGSLGKDKLEESLYLQMKAGTISQADAVKQIYGWFTAVGLADSVLQVSSR